jgi:outer membrane protein OmpA-like peptidoglycan-associated protein
MRRKLVSLCALSVFSVSACSQGPALRGKIAGLSDIVEQAERNGAIRCAPRELAVAKSQLEFATLELDQGFISKANAHLWKAEPNAHAAYFLSPPQYCAERGFVEVARPAPGDRDGDGFLDPKDKCPDQAENFQGFEDDDGCPDPDNDKDTVPDIKDQCPNEIGSTTQEPLGCPTKPALVVVTDCEVKITQQIHFEFNKDKIRPESFPVLDAVVEALQKNQAIKIEVQGHTDNKGSAAYNKNLSDRRAKAVMKYLLEHGIELSRLTSHGYGFERPLVDNSTEQNRALNRRVQFVRTEGVKEGCPKPSGG